MKGMVIQPLLFTAMTLFDVDIADALGDYKKNKKYTNFYVFNELFELNNMQVLTKATQSSKKRNWIKIN